jgi:putative pyrimidine permease RutG
MISILLGFMPKFSSIMQTIPLGITGGMEILLFGWITVTGARIWVNHNVDLSEPRAMVIAGLGIMLGSGMQTLPGGVIMFSPNFQLDGIGMSAIVCVGLNILLFLIPDHISHRTKKK